jgi:hypothetical protein
MYNAAAINLLLEHGEHLFENENKGVNADCQFVNFEK